MSEQEKCHAPVNYTSDCGTVCSHDKLVSQEEIEPVCRDSKSVRILQEFRQIYEERLRKIDEDNGGKGMEVKLKTLTSWINDLGEQNLMLVETVEQLEREAAGRVALLEERLKKSSHAALEYMSKLEEYDNQILYLSEGKSLPRVQPTKNSNKLVQAQQTEEILRTRVSNLQNDISSLLELIRRARYDGTWDTNGLAFLEVTYEDIFGSYPFQVDSDSSKVIDYSLMASIDSAFSKPNTNSSVNQAMEVSILKRNLEDAKFQLQKTMKDNEQLVKEIEFLSAEMKRKTEKIASLSQNLSEVEKKELEYRMVNLEATYFRLEKSWKYAWEIAKSGALDDFIYCQDAPKEEKAGISESYTFDASQEITWSTLGIEEDQEKIRELFEFIKILFQQPQQSTKKRGIGFASPSKEDYKFQVQELQKALKQAQNGAELARKQVAKKSAIVNDGTKLARHIEESRVNVVLAQAAIEETVEEIEAVGDILQNRAEKICELELLLQSLQKSFIHFQLDAENLLNPITRREETVDAAESHLLSSQPKVQMISVLLKSLESELKLDGVAGTDTEVLIAEPKHRNIPQNNSITKINLLVEDLAHLEKEMTQKYCKIRQFHSKVQELDPTMQDAHKKINEYIHDKEIAHSNWTQSEQKIKKLLLELESVQEDLEECLKTFEPSDVECSDTE